MIQQRVPKWLASALLTSTLLALPALGQDAPNGNATKYSTGVDDILKMVQAGVSKDVIKTYIDNSPIPYSLTASDLIGLKERGITDDLTTALMKRGAVVRAQANQPAADANTTEPRASASGARTEATVRSRLDPEGYDYFWYYYLYPRTLAFANQRYYSGAAGPDFYPYTYGYYYAAPFRPLPYRRPF